MPSSSILRTTDASPPGVTSAMTSAAFVQPASKPPVASPNASRAASGANAGQTRESSSPSDPMMRWAGSPGSTSMMSNAGPPAANAIQPSAASIGDDSRAAVGVGTMSARGGDAEAQA